MKRIFNIFFIIVLLVGCSPEKDSSPTITKLDEPTITPPGKSSLSSPSNNEICYEGVEVDNQNSIVTFSWEASSDTDSYDLLITNQISKQTQTLKDITSLNKDVTLTTDISYSWQVQSKSNKTTEKSNSDIWQFYLAGDGQENYAPFPATIINPKSAAKVNSVNGTVNLNWEGNDPDGDLIIYTIYFDDVDGLQEPNDDFTDISETSIKVNVESRKTYYWRVKSSDGKSSSFTLVYSFIVN